MVGLKGTAASQFDRGAVQPGTGRVDAKNVSSRVIHHASNGVRRNMLPSGGVAVKRRRFCVRLTTIIAVGIDINPCDRPGAHVVEPFAVESIHEHQGGKRERG